MAFGYAQDSGGVFSAERNLLIRRGKKYSRKFSAENAGQTPRDPYSGFESSRETGMDPRITTLKATTLSGRRLTRARIADVQETVAHLPNESRNEPVKVIRGRLNWKTAKGDYRVGACMGMLEILEARGVLKLPAKREARAGAGDETPVWTTESGPQPEISATLAQLAPVRLEPVTDTEGRQLWNALVDRHHYLGHRKPFGQHIRYSSSTGTAAGWAACCPALARNRFRRGTGGWAGRTGSATATAIRCCATRASWCFPGSASGTLPAMRWDLRPGGCAATGSVCTAPARSLRKLWHWIATPYNGTVVSREKGLESGVWPNSCFPFPSFASCGTACPSLPLLEGVIPVWREMIRPLTLCERIAPRVPERGCRSQA